MLLSKTINPQLPQWCCSVTRSSDCRCTGNLQYWQVRMCVKFFNIVFRATPLNEINVLFLLKNCTAQLQFSSSKCFIYSLFKIRVPFPPSKYTHNSCMCVSFKQYNPHTVSPSLSLSLLSLFVRIDL